MRGSLNYPALSPACSSCTQNRRGFQGFTPCARVAGTHFTLLVLVGFTDLSAYYFVLPELLHLFGAVFASRTPLQPTKTLIVKLLLVPLLLYKSDYFFFLHCRRRMPAKFYTLPMQGSGLPGRNAICYLGTLPGYLFFCTICHN